MWSWLEEEDKSRVPWVALAALMAVAAVLRAIGLNRDLWLDEFYTLIQTVRRVGYMIKRPETEGD